jgi:hypothetical protein
VTFGRSGELSTRQCVCMFRGRPWQKLLPLGTIELFIYRTAYLLSITTVRGRDSAVGIATRYRLEGPGIESRWGRDIPHPSRPAVGPTQPPIQWVQGLFPGDKTAGARHWPPTSSSAEVEEGVELYIYSSSGPSWPVLGQTLCVLVTFVTVWSLHSNYIPLLEICIVGQISNPFV